MWKSWLCHNLTEGGGFLGCYFVLSFHLQYLAFPMTLQKSFRSFPAPPTHPCFCGCSVPGPFSCRLREAKPSFLAPEKGRRVMWFTLFVQNPACLFANVSNRKALLSKLMKNFKVGPRAVFHGDNNTQISGVSKLGGSSYYWLERLLRQTQVINILLEALCCQGE